MPTPASQASTVPDALVSFKHLPDDARARLPVVCALYAQSPATIWRRVAAGLIPAPSKTGNVTSWRVGDLRAALASINH